MTWTGRVFIGTGWAAFVGRAGDNKPHAHHALQLVVGLEAAVPVWTEAEGVRWVHSAVLDRDLRHALQPSEGLLGLLYLDAESTAARTLRLCTGVHERLAGNGVHHDFDAATQGDAVAVGRLLAWMGAAAPDSPSDAVIRAVIQRLHSASVLPASFAEVSAWTSLSCSRFAHRFRDYTGMPVRPYLRWLRLQRAAQTIAARASITEAAHAAGFADAAHLARTFQRHFGITPSVLASLSARPQ